MSTLPTGAVYADGEGQLPLYSLSSPTNEFGWYAAEYDFTDATANMPKEAALDYSNIEPELGTPEKSSKKSDKKEFVDDILSKLPYRKTLAGTWKVIDGQTDLYIEGLRVDRRAKGVSYTTSEMPFIGNIEGMEFKATGGMSNEVTLESEVLPLIGRIDGLKFKSKVSDENSSVSLRYTTSLEKLGF